MVRFGLLFIEVVRAMVHPSMRPVGHHPEALLDQMALPWCVVAEVGDELLQHLRLQDGALDILGAGIVASLQLQYLRAARGHRAPPRCPPAPITIASNFSSII